MPKVMAQQFAAKRRLQAQQDTSDSEAKVSIPENSVKTPKVSDPKVSIPENNMKKPKASAASTIYSTRNAYINRSRKPKVFAEAAKRRTLKNAGK